MRSSSGGRRPSVEPRVVQAQHQAAAPGQEQQPGQRQQQGPRVVAADPPGQQGRAQGGSRHPLPAQPAQDRGVLVGTDVAAAELRLRQPQHRAAQLAGQRRVAQQASPRASVARCGRARGRPGRTPARPRRSPDRRSPASRPRRTPAAARQPARASQSTLARDREEQLLHLVEPHVVRGHRDEDAVVRVARRADGPLEPGGRRRAADDGHLHGRAARGEVAGEVVLAEEGAVVGHAEAASPEHRDLFRHGRDRSGRVRQDAVNDTPQ